MLTEVRKKKMKIFNKKRKRKTPITFHQRIMKKKWNIRKTLDLITTYYKQKEKRKKINFKRASLEGHKYFAMQMQINKDKEASKGSTTKAAKTKHVVVVIGRLRFIGILNSTFSQPL